MLCAARPLVSQSSLLAFAPTEVDLPHPLDLLLLVTVASPLASSAHRRSLAVCPSASRVLDPVLSALLATMPLAAHASRRLTQASQCLAGDYATCCPCIKKIDP